MSFEKAWIFHTIINHNAIFIYKTIFINPLHKKYFFLQEIFKLMQLLQKLQSVFIYSRLRRGCQIKIFKHALRNQCTNTDKTINASPLSGVTTRAEGWPLQQQIPAVSVTCGLITRNVHSIVFKFAFTSSLHLFLGVPERSFPTLYIVRRYNSAELGFYNRFPAISVMFRQSARELFSYLQIRYDFVHPSLSGSLRVLSSIQSGLIQ